MGERTARRRFCALPAVLVALLVPLATTVDPSETATGGRAAGEVELFAPAPDAVGVAARSQRRAYAPRKVAAGGRIVVVGKVATGRHHVARVVRLKERVRGHWVVRDRDRANRRGHYRVVVRAGTTVTTRVFQVTAPRKRGLRAVRTHRLHVRVAGPAQTIPTPAPAGPDSVASMPEAVTPAGLTTDWSSMFSDGGGRWDPCTTIRWRYNPRGGYNGALSDVQAAFDALGRSTGLTFSYAGTTSYVPFSGADNPGTAEFYVGWAAPAQVPGLAGGTVGLGGPVAAKLSAPQDVTWKIVSGSAVFDTTAVSSLAPGFATTGNATWGQVMVHEIIHGLGLGHAVGRSQLMAPIVSDLNHYFGAGDLTGLDKVGATKVDGIPTNCLN